MASLRLALEQAQRILDRVDQRPGELEQLPPCAPRENQPCQRLASCGSTLGQLAAKLGKGDRLVT